MDLSEYMPMFLAEAREHLQELNLAIVKLEDDPKDRDTVDGIFRIAHSLKGMSATMGFAQIAKLTHEMEEVFELLRQRSGAMAPEAIDTVLACLDALSAGFDSIEETSEESVDPTALIERLHQLVRTRTPEQEVERRGGADVPELQAEIAAGERVLHVVADLDEQVLMPAVRAHMVLAAAADYGEVLGSVPAQEGLENFAGRRVEVWLSSELDEETVRLKVSSVTDVAFVTVAEVDEVMARAVAEEAPVPDVAPEALPMPVAPVVTDSVTTVDVAAPTPAPSAPEPARTKAPAQNKSARTVRVDAERLDALMHSMGELVIHRTAVEALTGDLDVPGLQHAVAELTRSSQALQSMVMQVRMIPVDVVFLRFPRLVRDLSSKLSKELELKLVGSETELDRTVVDALGDPLVHLVRNSLDHGLEGPDDREAAGKPRTGTLTLSARHAGGFVVIEVADDGRGINPEVVARKALEKGLIDAETAANIDMRGAVELLFAAGFSTADVTSDISGRGVGMDVVRTKIRELGGEVVMESTRGVGTRAQIRLPLTLAIVSALEVDIAGDPFAIPLDRIERTLRLTESMVSSVAGRRMLVLQDGVLPLLEAGDIFGRQGSGTHNRVVIVRAHDRRLALAVDELVGQRELVTRPLPGVVSDGQPVSGGAALADGRIALIVDCDALGVAADTPAPTRTRAGVPVAA